MSTCELFWTTRPQNCVRIIKSRVYFIGTFSQTLESKRIFAKILSFYFINYKITIFQKIFATEFAYATISATTSNHMCNHKCNFKKKSAKNYNYLHNKLQLAGGCK